MAAAATVTAAAQGASGPSRKDAALVLFGVRNELRDRLDDMSAKLQPFNPTNGVFAGHYVPAPDAPGTTVSAPFPWRSPLSQQETPWAKTHSLVMKNTFVAINAELECFCLDVLIAAARYAAKHGLPAFNKKAVVEAALTSALGDRDSTVKDAFLCALVQNPAPHMDLIYRAHIDAGLRAVAPHAESVVEAFAKIFRADRAVLRDSITAVLTHGEGRYFLVPSFTGKFKVHFTTINSFELLSKFYYSWRCALAHGSVEEAFRSWPGSGLKFTESSFGGSPTDAAKSLKYFNKWAGLLDRVRLGQMRAIDLDFSYQDYVAYLRFTNVFAWIICTALWNVLIPLPVDQSDEALGFDMFNDPPTKE